MKFSKNLTPSEAKYKYLGLSKKTREEFPPKDQVFKLKFKGKSYDMKVNNKNSIMLTQLFHVYTFQEDDEVTLTKISDNNFEFSVK